MEKQNSGQPALKGCTSTTCSLRDPESHCSNDSNGLPLYAIKVCPILLPDLKISIVNKNIFFIFIHINLSILTSSKMGRHYCTTD